MTTVEEKYYEITNITSITISRIVTTMGRTASFIHTQKPERVFVVYIRIKLYAIPIIIPDTKIKSKQLLYKVEIRSPLID